MKNIRSIIILAKVLVISVFLVGCTRKTDSNSKINFKLDPSLSKPSKSANQKISALSVPDGYFAAIMIANVHYDGKTAKFEWECPFLHGQQSQAADPSDCEFPTFVDFNGKDFPKGIGRIVQVLLVYQSENGGMLFAYDDALNIEFNQPLQNIVIGTNWRSQGGSSGSTKIAGRYGTTLSGHVEGFYKPLNTTAPAIKLFDEYINVGWFELMYLSGVNIYYQHKASGKILFNSKSLSNISSDLGTTGSKAAMSLSIPAFYSVWEDGGNGFFSSDKREQENVIVGFWDENGLPLNNSPNNSLKFSTTSTDIDSAYLKMHNGILLNPIDENDASLWTDPADPTNASSAANENAWSSHRLEWNLASSSNEKVRMISGLAGTDINACPSSGPNPIDSTNPMSASCINIDEQMIANRSLVPFEGAFTLIGDGSGHGSSLVTQSNGNDYDLSFSLVPGAAGTSVHGVAIFLIDDWATEMFHDNAPCAEMASANGISGLAEDLVSSTMFVPYSEHFQSIAVTAANGSDYVVTIPDSLTNGKSAVACPWRNLAGKKQFHPRAAYNHGFYYGGGGSSMQPAVGLRLTTLTGVNQFNAGVCTPLLLEFVDANNNVGFVNGNYSVTLSHNGGDGDFFEDKNCNSIISSALTFNNGPSEKILYFMRGSPSGPFNVYATEANLIDSSIVISSVGSNSAPVLSANSGAKIIARAYANAFECVPVHIIATDSNGVPVDPTSDYTIYLDDVGASGNFYYNMQNCEDEINVQSSTMILGSQQYVSTSEMYYRNNVGGSYTLQAGNSGLTIVADTSPIQIQQPGPAEHIWAHYHSQNPNDPMIRTGFCYQLNIRSEDADGRASPVASAAGLNVTGTNVKFSYSNDCSALQTTLAPAWASGLKPSVPIYFLPENTVFYIYLTSASLDPFDFGGPLTANQTVIYRTSGTTSLTNGAALNFGLKDQANNPISTSVKNYPTNVSFSITLNSGTAPLGFDPTSPGCGSPVASPTVPAFMYSSNLTQYFCKSAAGVADINVLAPGIITDPTNLVGVTY